MDLSFLTQLNKARVLVVGDVMLDRYWHGDTGRISPEAPVPVVKVSQLEDKAGGAANVARNISHLDAQVSLVGLVGEDECGDKLAGLLNEERIGCELVKQCSHPTIAKMRVISRHQQVVRLDLEEFFSENHSQLVLQRLKSCLDSFDFVVFSDYSKGTLNLIQDMIQLARDAGKTVLVDPKNSDLNVYRGAHFITPNLTEFKAAGGQTDSEQALTDSARKLLNECGIEAMLLTRSEQGMSLISQTEKYDFSAEVREVSDVTGAGDTVIATLAVMLAAGLKPELAVEVANIAAGIVVGKLGAGTVTPEELAAKLSDYLLEKGNSYQTPFSSVLQHIALARANGEKIVFTNGCFDILHAGHVTYLEEARALGDKLVVGLNNDESITRLKGEDRPINSLHSRARILNALQSVDWVIPFGELENNDTPAKLIEQVNPDVLVKGGDYQIENIAGAEYVLNQGGEVQVLSFVDGYSSSKIINTIKQTT